MDITIKHKGYNIVYVDTRLKLDQCVRQLNATNEVAFDIEFDKDLYQYGFNICLVQVATHNQCFVIDPLKDIDLGPLFRVFENPAIVKVASAPEQDIRLLHTLNCFPRSIFDTDTAARLLNYEFTSIGKLVAMKYDVVLDKKLQTSNWGQRPLTLDQIRYSVDDVIYLIKLRKDLEEEAREKGILHWLEDETKYYDEINYDVQENDDFLSRDDKKLSPYHQFVLNELLKLRDMVAQKLNKPTNSVIVKSLLIDIVMEVADVNDWLSMKGIIYSIKNEEFRHEITDCYNNAVKAAQDMGLPTEATGNKLTREEREELNRQKAHMEAMKVKIFAPIQADMINEYGAFAARFILSNAKVNDLLKDGGRISDMRSDYKKNLILKSAQRLNINLGEYQ